ncbi:2-(3-amino-3-carboxypropyl)histidine synthase [Candidatus Anstonella stagnisolia]|nr:2-(3-amino-3-carboxypropyl)histidine synthase [Candidatus Anstonella stagnisolia]
MRIILQFPEGLKQKAQEYAQRYEKEGHEVFVASAPCYGACDLCIDEARAVGAQKLVHVGHAEFMKMDVKGLEIEYIPYFDTLPKEILENAVEKALEMLHAHKKIALVTTVQHIGQIEEIKKAFEKGGKKILLEKGGKHVRHEGQILGCDSIAASKAAPNADCVVYFGGGQFHPLGIRAGKPVLVADPYLGKAYWITEEIEKLEKKRKGAILASAHAKNFGIIVSTKNGQFNLTGARLAKKELEKRGKKALLLVSNEIFPLALEDFNMFDAYISTACPRIGDDHSIYKKPIIDFGDFKRVLELMDAVDGRKK